MLNFQHDPVDYYGAWLLAGMLILGSCLVLFTLVRYRGRLAGPAPWAVLGVGIGILPLILISFGAVLAVSRSKKVEFCASCHTPMQVYVNDMLDPSSASLAAVHYKNRYIPSDQCYVCHTSPGLTGAVQAKTQGIVDLYKYYTGTFHVPLAMRNPYRNSYCLKCHAEAAKFLVTIDHRRNQAALFSGKRACMDCHGEAAPAHSPVFMPAYAKSSNDEKK